MHLYDNYSRHVNFASKICWLGTSKSILFLLFSGFYPATEGYNWVFLSLILFATAPTILSIINIERVKSWAVGYLDKRMAYRDHLKYGTPYEEDPKDYSYSGIEGYVRFFEEQERKKNESKV